MSSLPSHCYKVFVEPGGPGSGRTQFFIAMLFISRRAQAGTARILADTPTIGASSVSETPDGTCAKVLIKLSLHKNPTLMGV